jgi:WXG100 family type VII secretion target
MANVNVTYDEMSTAAKRLKAGHDEMTGKLNELQKLVNGLVNGGYVTDSSSKQFESAYTEFTSGASRTLDGLHQMCAYLDKAAITFREADERLSSQLHH